VYCTLNNIQVHYETRGQGRPLILLHGFWSDYHQMIGCMETGLADRPGWQRIYLDLPGMGQTPGEAWISNSDHMLDVICDFIDQVLPGKRFALGGYSYGGYLARGVLTRKADMVDGLLLACPMINDIGERNLPPQEVLVSDPVLMARLTEEQQEEFEWVAVQSRRIWIRIQEEMNPGFALGDAPFLTKLQEEGYPFSFDVEEAMVDPLEKPTLIVAGRQDWIVGYRDAWQILEKYPRATFAVLDRAGHNLPLAQDHLFDALVGEWLDRLEEEVKEGSGHE
jgi:pimeloyl-ACP methyl ester carboxylesterase